MRSCHRAQTGGTVHQFLHLRLGFLVCLLPLGVLQPVADSRLVDIGDVRTKDLVLTAQLVHLMFEFAVAFLHAIEQSVRDAAAKKVFLPIIPLRVNVWE